MALTNAEKVRRYRERQKALKQAELLKPTPPTEVFKKPFFEFFTKEDQIGGASSQCLELAGFVPVPFDDDTGPDVSTLDDLSDPWEEGGFSNPFGEAKGSSLGKAEVVVALLLDAVSSATCAARWGETDGSGIVGFCVRYVWYLPNVPHSGGQRRLLPRKPCPNRKAKW